MTKKMNIVYRLGTKQDIDAICLLIQQASLGPFSCWYSHYVD